MYVISTSCGNDSVATQEWARQNKLQPVTVAYIGTQWAKADWESRVLKCEAWAKSIGFDFVRIQGNLGFEDLIKHKKGFPNQRYQWCSGHLKGIPFLEWIDGFDPECKATIIIGKRREESRERENTPEFVESSEYHGGRRVWHPLYLHTSLMRDALLADAGFEPLPYRSQECSPCVNANRSDFLALGEEEIARVEALEKSVGKTMFRPKRHMGAVGIRQVVEWARAGKGKFRNGPSGCSSGYCGF